MDVLVKVIGFVLMVVGFGGVMMFKRRQPVALVMLGVLLAGLFWTLHCFDVIGSSQKNSKRQNEYAFNASTGYVAAKRLAAAKTGAKLIVVVDPEFSYEDSEKDASNHMLIEAVKQGFGSDNVAVVKVDLPQGAAADDSLRAAHVDALMAQHPDAGAYLMVVSLPANAQRMKIFRSAKHAPIALLRNASMISSQFLESKIKSGDILGIVLRNPELKAKKIDALKLKATGDYEETFQLRYIFADKTNVGKVTDQL